MEKKPPILWDLFITMAKVGAVTFGGGYAMLSLLSHICVEEKKWLTDDEMLDITVIAESTPGPIAINCATYVGMKHAGIPGSLVATFAMVLPSFVIIFCLSGFLDHFLEYPMVVKAFRGIQVGVALIILRVGIQMIRKMQKKPFPLTVMLCAFAAVLTGNLFALNFSTISLMITAGAAGLLWHNIRKGGGTK